MKQIVRILNILILSSGLLLFFGCNKIKYTDNKDELKITEADKNFVDNVKKNISEFKQYKEGKLLKSTETISIDSALLFLDETFNYSYSYWYTPYSKLISDTSYIEIPLTEEDRVIKYCDLFGAYDNAVTNVRNNFYDYQLPDKRVVGFQVQNLGPNPQTGNLRVRFISQILSGQGFLITQGDDYYFEVDSHLCDGTIPPQGDCGAANIVEQDVNFILLPAPPPKYRVFFTEEEKHEAIATNFPAGNPIDNFEDYYIYYGNSSNPGWVDGQGGTTCIEDWGIYDSEMDFYIDAMIDNVIPIMIENLNLDGKSFSLCEVVSSDQMGYPRIVQHKPYITFGYKHIWRIESEPIQYPSPL